MIRVLLLGAGFSKNWGGWLAKELFGKLCGHPLVAEDPVIKASVWKHKKNFEDALAELRNADARRALILEKSIRDVFEVMNAALVGDGVAKYPLNHPTCVWLTKFDAIFTLNQDLLLEGSYIARELSLVSTFPKWSGVDIPGMVPDSSISAIRATGPTPVFIGPMIQGRKPDCVSGYQPYYKLHGSTNWRDSDGNRMLVIGSNKRDQITSNPLFSHYHEQFQAFLARPNCRLVVIGYGFRDTHINQCIEKASMTRELRMFVVDPLGVEATRGEHQRIPGAINDGVNSQSVPFEDIILGESADLIRPTLEGRNDAELTSINAFLMLGNPEVPA